MSWLENAVAAALALMTGEEREDDSAATALLRDIHGYFESNDHDRVRTADLLDHLHKLEESPWGDWYGKPLSAHGLGRLLKPYRIKTMPVWVESETARGYKAEQFDDAFVRVLGVRSVRSVRSQTASQNGPNTPNAPNACPSGGATPLSGDAGFDEFLIDAVQAGHITAKEADERYEFGKLIRRRSTDEPPPA